MQSNNAQTRALILEVSKREFEAKGFQGASMRTIASGAGVSAAGLYNYFESKDAIFLEFVSPCVSFLKEMGSVPQTPKEVKAVLKKYIAAQEKDPDAFNLAFAKSRGSSLFRDFIHLTKDEDPLKEFRARMFFLLLQQIAMMPMSAEARDTLINSYLSAIS